VQNVTSYPGSRGGDGVLLSGYTLLPLNGNGKVTVTVRIGTSFISVDQARRNIDAEIPDSDASQGLDTHLSAPQTLERTAQLTRAAWAERLNMFVLEGATEVQKEVFWTGVVHALQVCKFS
jgi:putative alpha-1,2-mannosidase